MKTKEELKEWSKSLKTSCVFVNNSAECKNVDSDTYMVEGLTDDLNFRRTIGKKQAIIYRFLQPLLRGKTFFYEEKHLQVLYYLLLNHVKFFSVMDLAQKDKKMTHHIISDLELVIEQNGVYKGQYVIQKANEIRKERIFFSVLSNSILMLALYSKQKMNYFDTVKKMMDYQAIMIGSIKSNNREENYTYSESINLNDSSVIIEIMRAWSERDFTILIKMLVKLFHIPMNTSAKEIILNNSHLQSRFGLPKNWNYEEDSLTKYIAIREIDSDVKLELVDFFEASGIVRPSYYVDRGKELENKINEIK